MELLLGAGANRTKNLADSNKPDWEKLITLDINPDHNPDVLHDLNVLPYPFEDNTFHEIHAYEVMEHVGQQGDYKFFFAQWTELWRILKPDGIFVGTSPVQSNGWAWGDPGHTRIISPECLTFLIQEEYRKQVGKTAMSDYRWIYKADFELLYLKTQEVSFIYVLRAIKEQHHADTEADR